MTLIKSSSMLRPFPRTVRVALGGGPGAGKTTAIAHILNRMRNRKVFCIVIPEVATEFFTHGLRIGKGGLSRFDFQRQLFHAQREREDRAFEAARCVDADTVLIVSDRSLIEIKAYCSKEEWAAILAEANLSETAIWNRYDAVLYLLSAAHGAEEYYTTANNPARREKTPEAARRACDRTRNAILGHPHPIIIGNETDFPGKLLKVEAALCHVLGIPEPIELERKYLVLDPGSIGRLPPAVTVDIVQHYLGVSDNEASEERVRSRSHLGVPSYYHAVKRSITEEKRVENEKLITAGEYEALLSRAHPGFDPIQKTRTCFFFGNEHCELDRIIRPERHHGLMMLEIERTIEQDEIALPPFLGKLIEVTDDPRYKNRNIARR